MDLVFYRKRAAGGQKLVVVRTPKLFSCAMANACAMQSLCHALILSLGVQLGRPAMAVPVRAAPAATLFAAVFQFRFH